MWGWGRGVDVLDELVALPRWNVATLLLSFLFLFICFFVRQKLGDPTVLSFSRLPPSLPVR